MKLAYKDLNADEKKREEKMKNMDPKKAEQMLRLGMGMGGGGSSGSRYADSVSNMFLWLGLRPTTSLPVSSSATCSLK